MQTAKTQLLTYSPNSPNAQSGIAVAEALSTATEKEWELIEDITLTEAVSVIVFQMDKINSKKEIYIEGYVIPTDTAVTNQAIQFNDGAPKWQASVNCKATGKFYIVMNIYKSPRNYPVFDGTVSAYPYTLSGASYKITAITAEQPTGNNNLLIQGQALNLRTSEANPMAAGTRIKVWGR